MDANRDGVIVVVALNRLASFVVSGTRGVRGRQASEGVRRRCGLYEGEYGESWLPACLPAWLETGFRFASQNLTIFEI